MALPNITLTFVSNNTVKLTNSSGMVRQLQFSGLNTTGAWTPYADIMVPANDNLTLTLVDNVYKLTYDTTSIIFMIYGNVLGKLKSDVSILLTSSKTPNDPAKYDFISLILLGLYYLGNNTYQNYDYVSSPTVDADLIKIATAIENSNKYLDIANNTPQANLIWK